MFYHRGSPKEGNVKWINHANKESKADQPDGPENVRTCEHFDEVKTKNFYKYTKTEQGKCPECRPPLSSKSDGIYICLLCGKQACKNHMRDDYECSVVHKINTKTVWCLICKKVYTPEIGGTLFERYYTECEHLKEPLFPNEESQPVKFKVKALMQICGKCLPKLPKKIILICLICGIKICCVEKAKQHNLLFYTHRLSLEVSTNTVYCHTCQKEFSHDEYSTVSIHGEYIKEQCELALQQLKIPSVVQDVTDHHDEENENLHQLPSNQLNLEQQVNKLTEERDQLREGYNQLQQQIDQLCQERDQVRERCSQLEQKVTQISQQEQQSNQPSEEHDQPKESDNEEQETRGRESEPKQHISLPNQEQAHLVGKQDDQLLQNEQQLNERGHEVEKQFDQLNQQYTELKQMYDELENLKNQLSEKNSSLKKQLKQSIEITQQRETQYKQQLKEDSEVMTEMHQQLNHMQHSLYNCRQQLDQKNSLIKASQFKYQTLENKLHEADTQNDILKQQNDNLQLENLKLKRELSQLSVTAQQKEDELTKLRLQLEQQFQRKPAARSKSDIQRKHLFLALLDYYPQSFCKSGHPEEELQLKAGDVVNVIGKMNSDGYYLVKFNDRQGLVPAHFLEEMNIKDSATKRRLRNQHLPMYTRHSSNEDVRHSLSESGDTDVDSIRRMSCDSSDDEVFAPQLVAPPTELRVECVSQNGLEISWTLPYIATLNDSNTLKIKGYLIFLNDMPRSFALGCRVTKASIKNINVDKPHVIAVATLTVNGTLSNTCQTSYQPKYISRDHNTVTGLSHSHQPSHSSHHQLMNIMQNPKPTSGQQRSQEDDVI